MSRQRRAWSAIGLLLLVPGSIGCERYDTKVTTAPSGPASREQPTVEKQTKTGHVFAQAKLMGSTIEVTMWTPRLCRKVTTTSSMETDAQPWQHCGDRKVPGADVVVTLKSKPDDLLGNPSFPLTLEARTDASGRARVDLTKAVGTLYLARNPKADVSVGEKHIATIDLADSQLQQLWLTDAKMAELCERYCQDNRLECTQTARTRAGRLECDIGKRKCSNSCTSSRDSRRKTLNWYAEDVLSSMGGPTFSALSLPIDNDEKAAVVRRFFQSYAVLTSLEPDLDDMNRRMLAVTMKAAGPHLRAIAQSYQAYDRAKYEAELRRARQAQAAKQAQEQFLWLLAIAAAARSSGGSFSQTPVAPTAGSSQASETQHELEQVKAEQNRQREAQEQRNRRQADRQRREQERRHQRELDCQGACDRCQERCSGQPGTDCVHACQDQVAACCSAAGAEPPQAGVGSCTCD